MAADLCAAQDAGLSTNDNVAPPKRSVVDGCTAAPQPSPLDDTAMLARPNPLITAFREWDDESPLETHDVVTLASSRPPSAADSVTSLVASATRERTAPSPTVDVSAGISELCARCGTAKSAGFLLACLFGQPLARDRVLEWLTDGGHGAELLAFVVYLLEFDGLDLEAAFRVFVRRLSYVPGEGQKQARLVEAFAARYYYDCRGQGGWRSVEAVSALAMGMFMINTMLHNTRVARQFQFDTAMWISHNAGRNAGQEYDRGMLQDIYDNVRDAEIVFDDAATHVVKHGWLNVRVAGALRTRRLWVELADGALRVLRGPSESAGVTTLLLEGARIVHHDDSLSFTVAPFESPRKETHFIAASRWAFSTWLAACSARAEPLTAVVEVTNPVYAPAPRRNSLVEVANPIFDIAAARPLVRSSLSLNDVHEVRVVNPMFVAAPVKRSSFREVDNPLFGHDPAVLLSPGHEDIK